MSSEFAEIRDKRRKFLKAVYDLARGRPMAHVSRADVAFRLRMDVSNREGFDEFMAIVQYFDDLGCIRTFQSGAEGYREYGDLRITGQGIDKVEESTRLMGEPGHALPTTLSKRRITVDPFPMIVLLATDGSEEAQLAAQMAASIVKRTGSELHLVCVVDLGAAADPRLQGGLRQKAHDLLEDQARKMRESGEAIAEAHMCIGQPDREIVALAEKVGAGLIVIGSRGMGGVRRALMGSISDSVIRHAHCPVLVVRKEKHQAAL